MGRVWSEIVFAGDADRAVLSRATTRRRLRRLAQGIYTSAVEDEPEQVVARNLLHIIGHELPGAVLVDRSARAMRATNGVFVIDHGRSRPLVLPGVVVVARRGPGRVDGDMPLPDDLWLSSVPRQLLDNLNRSRGAHKRVLGAVEVEDWVDSLVRERGIDGINQIRSKARDLAPLLGRNDEFARLDALISAALTTGPAGAVSSGRLKARASGVPFDDRRVAAFEALAEDLVSHAPSVLVAMDGDEGRRRLLPFYEAYFSNYIEGTEFTLDEAAAIVLDGNDMSGRPADAHDILGTFEIVSDIEEMRRIADSFEEFEALLCQRHAVLMGGRPEMSPGRFKERANRAGGTEFAAPELVVGTLKRGFETLSSLVNPFARAVYMMFLVAEVHPFTDGNGRLARVMMNAELVRAGEVRIIVPTVYRNNYLAALKGATHNGNFAALFSVLEFARRWTGRVDFSNRERAEADLALTHALRDATDAENAGVKLVLP